MIRQDLATVWPPSARVAAKAGHPPMSPLQAIRRKCLDCSGGQYLEVRSCEAIGCPLWPFRSGLHPYTRSRLLEADADKRRPAGIETPADPSSTKTPLQQASCQEGVAFTVESGEVFTRNTGRAPVEA